MIVEIKGINAWRQYENWQDNVEKQVSKILNQDVKFEQIEIVDEYIYKHIDDYCKRCTVRVSNVDLSKLSESAYRRYVKE